MVKDMKNENEKKNPILKVLLIILLIIFSLLLYSRFIATSGLKVKEYKIENSNIPNNFHGFKIIHLSDIHYGRTITSKRLEEIVEKINFIKPDIVVLTGDLLDKNTELSEEQLEELSNILSKINVTIGKYAISGNHDCFFENWENIIENGGFTNLNNTYEYIYKEGYEPLLLSGLNTRQEETSVITRYNTLQVKIENSNIDSIYNILLLHEPDLIDNINIEDYQLILAGHSHNGQIRLPFIGAIIKPDGAKKYYDEYYELGNTKLYISSGLGTSGLDFRLFNRPSINFYRLTNK